MRMIARRLGLNFKTVRRYVRVASVDELLAGGIQVTALDPFKPYLNDRLADGERNATRLLAEITGQGYPGGYNTLARYLRPLRRMDAATLAELPPRPAPPAVRQVTGWITGLPSNLGPGRRGAAARDPAALPRAGRRRPVRGRVRPDDQGPVRRREHAHQMDRCGRHRPAPPCGRSPPACAATRTPSSPG